MPKNNLIKNILNKSDFGGINWVNSFIAIIFVISIIYVAYCLTISENKLTILLLYILIFTMAIISIIFITNKITLLRTKKALLKNNEKIIVHLFGSYIFDNSIPLDNLIFNDTLNKYMIDVIIILTSKNNVYITPIINYTKQPIIKIPLNKIKNIETSNLNISRQKMSDWFVPVTIATIGFSIPINQIQSGLDSRLPINRIYFGLKTNTSGYRLLLPKKERSIFFIRTISGK